MNKTEEWEEMKRSRGQRRGRRAAGERVMRKRLIEKRGRIEEGKGTGSRGRRERKERKMRLMESRGTPPRLLKILKT